MAPIEAREEDLMEDLETSEEGMESEKEVAVQLLGILVQWDHLFQMMEWVGDGVEEWAVTWVAIWEEWKMEWVEA